MTSHLLQDTLHEDSRTRMCEQDSKMLEVPTPRGADVIAQCAKMVEEHR